MTFLSFICFLYYTVILVQCECPSSVKKTKTKKNLCAMSLMTSLILNIY